jgi:plasmid replication initiation protein
MENLICNKELSVVQANELIRSKQDDLSLLEAKLIKVAISQIVMDDTDLRTYTCRATELADFLGIDQKTIYRDLETLAATILKKVISIKDKSKPRRNGQYNYKKFHWVDSFEYYNGLVTIKISEELKPYLLGLNALFTEYGLDSILGLPTPNSIRLFELLSSYESLTNPYSLRNQSYSTPYPHIPKAHNELIFSIEYLRKYFNCENKYPNTNHFIQYVIDISVKGINKNNPTMRVSYRTVKEGRSLAYVLFKINAWEDTDFIDFIRKD